MYYNKIKQQYVPIPTSLPSSVFSLKLNNRLLYFPVIKRKLKILINIIKLVKLVYLTKRQIII